MPRRSWQSFSTEPRYSSGVKIVARIQGSSIVLDLHHVGHVGRVVQFQRRAVAQLEVIDDRRRGRDQVEVELALQPLLNDLEMQQPEKAAAEAEAERGRGFHLV